LAGGALALSGAGAAYFNMRQMGSMEDYNASVAAMRATLTQTPEIRDFIRYATLAANSHNTQPWRFRLGAGQIEILPDLSRRIPVVDPDDHHIFASLGCAGENMVIAAAARGCAGDLQFKSGDPNSLIFSFGNVSTSDRSLFDAVPLRQSTRSDYDGRPVGASDLATLATTAKVPGADLVLITDRAEMNKIRDIVIAANSAQMANPAFVRELKTWLRFNPRQAMVAGDGLFGLLTGNPSLPTWLGPPVLDWFFNAASENKKYIRQIASSAGLAIFVSEHDNPEHWIAAGRSSQRFALQATALGLKHAFVNQPVEVVRFRPELAALVGMAGRRPDLIMRFGYGPAVPFSVRRPVADFITA
jgi:hypothetical protein